MNDARYTKLSDEERDALPPKEREAYDKQRAAFDREVEALREQLRTRGYITWMNGKREERITVPIRLVGRRTNTGGPQMLIGGGR